MAVAIVGMHRSGTSLVAQMLAKAGLYLGREEDILPAGPDNPDGYWEHAGFHRLNERVLAELGGGWDSPPVVPRRWRDDARLGSIAADAENLVAEFRGRDPWGWKDPRTSVTLALWNDLIPGPLKVVVCLRNPLEVAFSLNRRGMFSYSTALRLWQTYNDRILGASADEQRLVTEYDAYFRRPKAELRRLASFVGLDVSPRTLEEAAAAPRRDLRHMRFDLGDLLDAQVASDIVELYAWLRKQAGPQRRRLRGGPPPAAEAPTRVVDEHALEAEALRQQLLELRPGLDFVQKRLAAREEELSEARRRETELARENELLRAQLERRDELVERLGDLQESFYMVEGALVEGPGTGESAAAYAKHLHRIKEIVRRETRAGDSVAVVTKGDERLLGLYGRRGLHFPQNARGAYAGGHPATSLSAIAHLELLRARGADYFLLPSDCFWWLEHYGDLRRHLGAHYRQVIWESDACALFDLRSPTEATTRRRAEAVEVASAVRYALGRSPTVLDWGTGLDLAIALPMVQVSGQSVNGRLPYPDESVDIVALASKRPGAADEAERVASAAVIEFPVGASDGEGTDVRLKVEASALAVSDVSVVVLVGADTRYVESGLTSLEETLPRGFAGEIVLVDDGGTAAELVDRLAGAHERALVVRSPAVDPLEGASRGAAAASEETLVIVDANLLLLQGWLRPLLEVLRGRPDAGAVGGRLLRPDGSLEEAGGIVFRDGSALRLGHGQLDPEAALFDYVRPVDFCSRFVLATRRQLFLELNGFGGRFGSDLFAAVDYCLALKRGGKRVYFQPASNAVRLASWAPERLLDRSRGVEKPPDRFVRKWRSLLKSHPSRPEVIDWGVLDALAGQA